MTNDVNKKGVSESVSFSQLTVIEEKHGLSNAEKRNHVVNITNELQEAHGGIENDEILKTIYNNISRNGVEYFYVLPKNSEGKMEIALLVKRLSKLKQETGESQSFNGGIYYFLDDSVLSHMPSEYYDIIVYVDFASDEKLKNLIAFDIEGYYCFSREREDNNYFFYPMSGYMAKKFYETWINKKKDFIKINL